MYKPEESLRVRLGRQKAGWVQKVTGGDHVQVSTSVVSDPVAHLVGTGQQLLLQQFRLLLDPPSVSYTPRLSACLSPWWEATASLWGERFGSPRTAQFPVCSHEFHPIPCRLQISLLSLLCVHFFFLSASSSAFRPQHHMHTSKSLLVRLILEVPLEFHESNFSFHHV